MTDEVLADLEAKIAAHEAHAENMRRNHGVTPNGMLVASSTVVALVAEVRRLREAEQKREADRARFDKARRDGTLIPLGRAGWALPPDKKG